MSEPRSREVYLSLRRRAQEERRSTQELFELYLLERFLYRLAISGYHDRFVLKGGLLLTAVGTRRPTRDADVLARNIGSDEATLLSAVAEIAAVSANDGLTFDASAARTETIREHHVYPGTRIIVPATLATAQLLLRLDVNFGDPVRPQEIEYPTLLDDEPFRLLGYPIETVIAEKARP